MGAQSFIMMFQAGEGWQYGKRRISAMSNEEFNKLTPLKLLQNQAANLRSSIGTISKSMNDMTPMIETIIRQYGDFLKEVIRVTPSVSLSVTGGQTPQQIVNQTVPSATGPERQALADLLSNLSNLIPAIPEAHGEHTTTIIDEGHIQGPLEESGKLEGPPAPLGPTGAIKTGFLAGPAPTSKTITQRFREFTTPRIKLQKKLNAQIVVRDRIHASINQRIRSAGGRGFNAVSFNAGLKKLKADLAATERNIIFIKLELRRL